MPFAKRALELSETVTDRERYFIRACNYGGEKGIDNYHALLHLHPDHFWAVNNLANGLRRLDRPEEACVYSVRRAQLRPNDFWSQCQAAESLFETNRMTEAIAHARRGLEVMSSDDTQRWPWSAAWMRLLPVQQHRLEGDPSQVQGELDRWARTLDEGTDGERPFLARFLTWEYAALGQSQRAREVARLQERKGYGLTLAEAFLALDRMDLAALREYLDEVAVSSAPDPIGETMRMMLAIEAGLLSRAEGMLAEFEATPRVPPVASWCRVVEGHLALAKNETGRAISLLEPALPEVTRSLTLGAHFITSPLYFMGSVSLANGFERQGDLKKALVVLEEASQRKSRTYPFSKLAWMNVQLHLLELFQKLGREAEAEEIESELRSHLARAEPDFPLLGRLDASREQARLASRSNLRLLDRSEKR